MISINIYKFKLETLLKKILKKKTETKKLSNIIKICTQHQT